MPQQPHNINLFFAYVPEDKQLKQNLVEHLSLLTREESVQIWDDESIEAGEDRIAAKRRFLNNAAIILLLISSDFMASDDADALINIALKRQESGEAKVIPVLLRETLWQSSKLSNLQVLPNNAKAVTSNSWPNEDAAFKNVALGIQKIVESLKENDENSPPLEVKPPTDAPIFVNTIRRNNKEKGFPYKIFIGLLALILSLFVAGTIASIMGEEEKDKTEKPITDVPAIPISKLKKDSDPFKINPPMSALTKLGDLTTRRLQMIEGDWYNENLQDHFLAKLNFQGSYVRVFSEVNDSLASWGLKKLIPEKNATYFHANYSLFDTKLKIEPQKMAGKDSIRRLLVIYPDPKIRIGNSSFSRKNNRFRSVLSTAEIALNTNTNTEEFNLEVAVPPPPLPPKSRTEVNPSGPSGPSSGRNKPAVVVRSTELHKPKPASVETQPPSPSVVLSDSVKIQIRKTELDMSEFKQLMQKRIKLERP